MSEYNTKEFKDRILNEIIEEVNRRQGVPVTFYEINIELKNEGISEGTLSCAETHHTWEIPLLVEIKENEVRWNANEQDGIVLNYSRL